MRVGPVSLLALFLLPVTLCAQRQGSFGIGPGIVRYAGGSSFSALTVSPAAQWVTPSVYLGAGGAISLLEGGVWAGQARADMWASLSRRKRSIRPAISATLATTTRSD